MYQKKGRKFTWARFFKALFVIVVIIIGAGYYMISTTLSGSNEEVDLFFNGFVVEPSLMKDINYTLLELRAQQFEELIGKYHIPRNMTGEGWDVLAPSSVSWSWSDPNWIYYNNSQLLTAFDPLNETDPHNDRNNMTYTGDTGHTALYEGVYTAGEAFRYAVAKRNNDATEMSDSLDRITELIEAYKLLSEVSGMGAWCRYAVPDTPNAHKYFPAGYFTTEDHFNVTYKGLTWVLSRQISRDVYCGVMLGMAMIYALVDDDEIREDVGDIIETTVQWLYDCNWRIVDVDGTQHVSADMIGARPMIDGQFLLYYLQMAMLVNPKKWEPIYYHYAYDHGVAQNMGKSMRAGFDLSSKIYDGYYGCNFVYYSAIVTIFLCQDETLREIYIKEWLNVLHNFCKLHRNALFDVVWLLCHTEMQDDIYDIPEITLDDDDTEIWKESTLKKPEDLDYIKKFCVRDIKDCLMRYAIRKYPSRNYYFATTPGTFPNIHQQPIPNALYPNYELYEETSDTSELINQVLESVGGRDITDPGLFNNSLPVDMRHAEDICWQRRSFCIEDTEDLTKTPGSFQTPAGPEYLTIYWIAKYLDILQPL